MQKRILFFIPLFLCLHNIEEAITMPEWIDANIIMLKEQILIFRYLEFSSLQLFISLSMVTIVPIIVSFVCLLWELTPHKAAVMLTMQAIIFWNGIMPHLAGVILLGVYNPGTVTALLVNIPYSLYLFHKAKTFQLPATYTLKKISFIGALIYLPLVYTNHLFAKAISRLL